MHDKWLQLCLTLCDPMDCSPSGSSAHRDSPGNAGTGCHALLQGIFPTQESNPTFLMASALADRFFIPSATWEAQINYSEPKKWNMGTQRNVAPGVKNLHSLFSTTETVSSSDCANSTDLSM